MLSRACAWPVTYQRQPSTALITHCPPLAWHISFMLISKMHRSNLRPSPNPPTPLPITVHFSFGQKYRRNPFVGEGKRDRATNPWKVGETTDFFHVCGNLWFLRVSIAIHWELLSRTRKTTIRIFSVFLSYFWLSFVSMELDTFEISLLHFDANSMQLLKCSSLDNILDNVFVYYVQSVYYYYYCWNLFCDKCKKLFSLLLLLLLQYFLETLKFLRNICKFLCKFMSFHDHTEITEIE